MHIMSASAKDSRIALRTSDETKARLKEAARITDQDLSSYLGCRKLPGTAGAPRGAGHEIIR